MNRTKKTALLVLTTCILITSSIYTEPSITHKKTVLENGNENRRFIIENSTDAHVRIPLYVKNIVQKCVARYPELLTLIDISIFLDTHRNITALTLALEATTNLINLLHNSQLATIDPDDTTIGTLQRYLAELESGDGIIDLENNVPSNNIDGTRSYNLFNTQTGIALSAGGELNIYGDTNITTQGSGNTVSIGLNNNLNITGSLALGSLTGGVVTASPTGVISTQPPYIMNSFTGGVVISSPTGVLSSKATTNNAVQIGNATGTLAPLGLGSNGQLLLGVSGSAPFFTGLSSPANPSGAASMRYTSGAAFLSLQSVPLFANVVRVDWLNGNDSTATVINGIPYKTISAALTAAGAAASSVSPYVILVMPGIYNETLTMQSFVSVAGISEGTGARGAPVAGVVIQQLGVTSSTTMVTMATNSRLENVSINLTSSSTSAINLIGVTFPVSSSASASIDHVNVCLTNTSNSATANIYGVYSTSTGSPASEIFAINNSVITASGGLVSAGIYFETTSSGLFNINNSTVTGTTGTSATNTSYGANFASGSTVSCKFYDSTINGNNPTTPANGYDVFIITPAALTLSNTNLANSTINPSSTALFSSGSPTSMLIWGCFSILTTTTTRYLAIGSIAASNVFGENGLTQIVIPRACVVKNLKVRANAAPGGALTTTFTVRKNGSSTTLSVTLTGTTAIASDTTHAITFAAGDLLSMQVATTSTATGGFQVSVEVF